MTAPLPPNDMRDPANHPLPSRPNTRWSGPPQPRPRYGQKSLVVGLLFAFGLIFWTIQLFILMTALDAALGGEKAILWPSAISSIVLALLTLVLVRLIPKDPQNE